MRNLKSNIFFKDLSIFSSLYLYRYELQRDLNAASEASEATDTFFLGDSKPVVLGEKVNCFKVKLHS